MAQSLTGVQSQSCLAYAGHMITIHRQCLAPRSPRRLLRLLRTVCGFYNHEHVDISLITATTEGLPPATSSKIIAIGLEVLKYAYLGNHLLNSHSRKQRHHYILPPSLVTHRPGWQAAKQAFLAPAASPFTTPSSLPGRLQYSEPRLAAPKPDKLMEACSLGGGNSPTWRRGECF